MKSRYRTWIYALIFFVLFFVVIRLVEKSSNTTAYYTNYAPDGFRKTFKAKINSRVISTRQSGLYYVRFSESTEYPFSYAPEKVPKGHDKVYPKDFIIAGDSVFKAAGSDAYIVYRGNKHWAYYLPGPVEWLQSE